MFDKQLYKRILFVGVAVVLLSGVACETATATPTPTPTPTGYENCPAWDPQNPPYREPMLPSPPDWGVTLHPTLVDQATEIVKKRLKDPDVIEAWGIEGVGEATVVVVESVGEGLWFIQPRDTLEDGRKLYRYVEVRVWATFESGFGIRRGVWVIPVASGEQCAVRDVAFDSPMPLIRI